MKIGDFVIASHHIYLDDPQFRPEVSFVVPGTDGIVMILSDSEVCVDIGYGRLIISSRKDWEVK